MMHNSRKNQSGAVSLFVVLFAALLITVITVSFLRLMVSDQRQASDADLSQSAYDSALAGVEDGKRALARYLEVCSQQGLSECQQLGEAINTAECNEAVRIGGVVLDTEGEVLVQQSTSTNDQQLDQAYTCVTISLLTDDYIGSIAPNESRFIPLIGKSADGSTDFTDVKIEWFSNEDISGNVVNLPGVQATQILPEQSQWPENRPPVVRAQLMQHGSSFTLEEFDYMAGNESNTNTLFLYPSSSVAATNQDSFTNRDIRRTSNQSDPVSSSRADTPLAILCVESIASGGYACSVTLSLPTPIDGGDRTAFLRLTSLYNASHFRVTLLKNGSVVQFNGVQPEIDSTGRASDLFRRVATRVDLIDTSFPYPSAAVQTTEDFCKSFIVTGSSSDYRNDCE